MPREPSNNQNNHSSAEKVPIRFFAVKNHEPFVRVRATGGRAVFTVMVSVFEKKTEVSCVIGPLDTGEKIQTEFVSRNPVEIQGFLSDLKQTLVFKEIDVLEYADIEGREAFMEKIIEWCKK